jgi:hypothetical protein
LPKKHPSEIIFISDTIARIAFFQGAGAAE